MTASMRLDYYPREWWDMAEEIAGQNKIWKLPFNTAKEAEKWRGQFYGFIRALRRAADSADIEASLGQPGVEDNIAAAKLAPSAALIMALISQDGPQWCLTLQLRSNSWQVKKMQERIVLDGPPPSDKVSATVDEINRALMRKFGAQAPIDESKLSKGVIAQVPGGPSEPPEDDNLRRQRERLIKLGFIDPEKG